MTSTLNSCDKVEPLIIPLEIKGLQGLLKNSKTFKGLENYTSKFEAFQNFRGPVRTNSSKHSRRWR